MWDLSQPTARAMQVKAKLIRHHDDFSPMGHCWPLPIENYAGMVSACL